MTIMLSSQGVQRPQVPFVFLRPQNFDHLYRLAYYMLLHARLALLSSYLEASSADL